MQTPTRIRAHLIVGFSVILILFSLATLYTMHRLAMANRHMEKIVTVHNEKISAVIDMRNAMRQRQVDLRDMVILPDAFDKDTAWQRYNAAASDFVIARARLIELGLDDQEQAVLDALNQRVESAYFLQQDVVDEVLDNQRAEFIYPLLLKAIENQDLASDQMRVLIDIQRQASRQSLETARDRYQETLLLSLLLGVSALLVGVLVAWMVIRRDEAMHDEIEQYHDHLEELVQDRTLALSASNKELEAFCHSVSHDLRGPLRGIDGFSDALLEDYHEVLDDTARNYLRRVKAASGRMGEIIDDLLSLSRITRSEIKQQEVDLSRIAEQVNEMIQARNPERQVSVHIDADIKAKGDPSLLRIVMENLLDNAWKFTRNTEQPVIRFNCDLVDGTPVYRVTDNGAGFDMQYASKLFELFQRLHHVSEYDGTGIGLVTVRRVVERHGGRVWAMSAPGEGASFFFTLGGANAQSTPLA